MKDAKDAVMKTTQGKEVQVQKQYRGLHRKEAIAEPAAQAEKSGCRGSRVIPSTKWPHTGQAG